MVVVFVARLAGFASTDTTTSRKLKTNDDIRMLRKQRS